MENLLPTCNYIFLISIRVLFLITLFKIFISLNKVNNFYLCIQNYVSGTFTLVSVLFIFIFYLIFASLKSNQNSIKNCL
jgi:hypothetical protein